MSHNLRKLLSSGSPSIATCEPELTAQLQALAGSLGGDLLGMLRERNGFYALESALHVFPSRSTQDEIGLTEWNEQNLWRHEYQDLTTGCLFFAEDVFGGQFCIRDDEIRTFDPETGASDYLADNFEGWATAVLREYEVLTGYPLAHQWQLQHGQLPAKRRLLPKVPFVAGGEFSIENLYLSEAIAGMKFRAGIARQVRNLPDGAKIKFEIID